MFAASVLSLRGNHDTQVTVQPMVCESTGNVLLWNGEIFNSETCRVADHENDGARLFDELNRKSDQEAATDSRRWILDVFESISGPYAFVYYVNATKCVYFGRDRFGRRSLLVSARDPNSPKSMPLFTLASVKVTSSIVPLEYQELKANGIYRAKLTGKKKQSFRAFLQFF